MNFEFQLAIDYYVLQNKTYHLTIKQTTLPHSNFLGLFANKLIQKGDVLCKYTGEVLRTVKAMQLQDKSYLMRLGEQVYIDAKNYNYVYARYFFYISHKKTNFT
jgi:hypothetical protein